MNFRLCCNQFGQKRKIAWIKSASLILTPFVIDLGYHPAVFIAHLEYQLDNSIMTQRTLRLRIGAGDVNQAIDRCAAKLGKRSQVAGFRKGKAPLAVVRRELQTRIAAEAFQELKNAALEQVMRQLEAADKPLLPPEVLEPAKVKVRYETELEFAVKYLIDPSGITSNPAQPEAQQGAVMPGSQVQHPAASGMPGAVGTPSVKLPGT